jgi:hypothetical protein
MVSSSIVPKGIHVIPAWMPSSDNLSATVASVVVVDSATVVVVVSGGAVVVVASTAVVVASTAVVVVSTVVVDVEVSEVVEVSTASSEHAAATIVRTATINVMRFTLVTRFGST